MDILAPFRGLPTGGAYGTGMHSFSLHLSIYVYKFCYGYIVQPVCFCSPFSWEI